MYPPGSIEDSICLLILMRKLRAIRKLPDKPIVPPDLRLYMQEVSSHRN